VTLPGSFSMKPHVGENSFRFLGRIGGRTLLYFLVTTVVAATVGLTLALAVGLGSNVSAGAPTAPLEPEHAVDFAQLFVNMLPQNPVASAAQGDLMPLIIAVCIFGAAATLSRSEGRRTLLTFFEGVYELSMIVIGWMMKLAPAAVLVLIASVIARSGAAMLEGLLVFVVTSTAAAFAGAGVPGSSLVTTLVVLNAIGLGPRASAGIALVAGVDRPLDMCRTLVNTVGNLVGAAWIDASEHRS